MTTRSLQIKVCVAVLASMIGAATLHGAAAPLTGSRLDPVLDADPFTVEALIEHPPANASAPLMHYLRGVAAAARLEADAATRELAAVYDAADAEPQLARRALSIAGLAALRSGEYGRAAELFALGLTRYGEAMDAPTRRGAAQNRDVALALRDEPAQTIDAGSRHGTIPLSVNPIGLTSAPVEIEGHAVDAVVDTGANLSVLSVSGAKAFGVRLVGAKASVRSATQRAVDSRIAVADTMRIGPATLHHVVFLVLDDEALSPVGPKHRIDAIIGFPVLKALGRVRFRGEAEGANGEPPKRSLTLLPALRTQAPGNLRFAGFDAYVRTNDGAENLPFVVDSGADRTSFEKRYAREFPTRVAGLELRAVQVGSAGGVENRLVAIVPKLMLGVGAVHVELANVQVHLNGNGSDTAYGTIGADVLWAKGGYTIDFDRLDLSLGGD